MTSGLPPSPRRRPWPADCRRHRGRRPWPQWRQWPQWRGWPAV